MVSKWADIPILRCASFGAKRFIQYVIFPSGDTFLYPPFLLEGKKPCLLVLFMQCCTGFRVLYREYYQKATNVRTGSTYDGVNFDSVRARRLGLEYESHDRHLATIWH